MRGALRLVAFTALWWIALFGFWLVLVGTNAGLELLAGACAAALGTSLAYALGRHGLLGFRLDVALLSRSWFIPLWVVRDFAVVSWALALHLTRVRPVRSAWVAVPFAAGRRGELVAGRRALLVVETNLSPNTIVVDIDPEREVALEHVLVSGRRRASESLP